MDDESYHSIFRPVLAVVVALQLFCSSPDVCPGCGESYGNVSSRRHRVAVRCRLARRRQTWNVQPLLEGPCGLCFFCQVFQCTDFDSWRWWLYHEQRRALLGVRDSRSSGRRFACACAARSVWSHLPDVHWLQDTIPYNPYYEYFGPNYKLHSSVTNMENKNSRARLEHIQVWHVVALLLTIHLTSDLRLGFSTCSATWNRFLEWNLKLELWLRYGHACVPSKVRR